MLSSREAMFEAAAALCTMLFREILRILDNHRHRASLLHHNVRHASKRFSLKTPGFLRFHIRLPQLPPVVTHTKAYAKLRSCGMVVSKALTNTPSMNAERIEKYVTPEGTTWAPHSPGPAMAMQVHRSAAVAVFAVIYLPYSFMVSIICSLAAVGLRAGFPREWRFSTYIGLAGWLPTLAFASVYLAGRQRINTKRKESWKRWTHNAERRIREFEGLHGPERAFQERRFFDWVRDGEGDEGWFFEELEGYSGLQGDEESAVTLGVRGDQWRSMVYSSDSGYSPSSSWATSDTATDSYGSDLSSEAGIRMRDLVPTVSEGQSVIEPDTAMLQLRSMESFDAAALASDHALSALPSMDNIAIPVADGAGTT